MAFAGERTHILSTEGMIDFAERSPSATASWSRPRSGILHRLHKELPGKRFEAGQRARPICRYMKMITLEKLRDSLRDWKHEVTVPRRSPSRARGAIERMVATG